MIAYRINIDKLKIMIESDSKKWLKKAKIRTDGFKKKGCFKEKSSIWSEIKTVYVKLQGDSKCAYCERKLESAEIGLIEQDIEHFRPKSGVKKWELPKNLQKYGITLSEVPMVKYGYYLLPYHPFNYSTSCKPCNSILKKEFFPISGEYDLQGEDPAKIHSKERPYLIYPIGDFDDNPEDLIKFNGASPYAVQKDIYQRDRALVTIEFFKLDDFSIRKNLFRERASIIIALYNLLEKQANGTSDSDKEEARKLVDSYTSPNAPHTNCSRSFKELYNRDPKKAKKLYQNAFKLVISIS
jgi:hypothetical protein